MKLKYVVVTLAVRDLERALNFYRQGLGLDSAEIQHGMITLELPGLLLFLAEEAALAKYTNLANTAPYLPGDAVECMMSCSVESQAEVDTILGQVQAAGGEIFEPQIQGHASGRRQYIGSFKDPDGHLWQLVCNLSGA